MTQLAEALRAGVLFRARQAARRLGYEIVRVRPQGDDPLPYGPVLPLASYSPWVADRAFLAAYDRVERHTMVDRYRCYELWQLVAEAQKVGGAVLEVGVRRGGTGCLMGMRMRTLGMADPIYLCDTFRGIVKASPKDPLLKGGEYADTSAEGVRALARELGVDNAVVLEGIFPEESAHLVDAARIALCHVDVDVYQSARDVVAWVVDRLPVGGMIVFDDYGFRGARGVAEYVNEVRHEKRWLFVHNLNGHAILVRRE
jgi:O-methyltransferase